MKKHNPQLNPSTDSTSAQSPDENEACTDQQAPGQDDGNRPNSMGLLALMGSVLAALFGIQSEKNRERDFQQSSPVAFISMGIIVVIGLVITTIIIVNTVISSTG